MATEIVMPRQGNSVESCVILEWRKNEGDSVAVGEIVCEVETDKATFEIESPGDGILLKQFFPEGADVPVLTVIAAVGESGENVSSLAPSGTSATVPAAVSEPDSERQASDPAPKAVAPEVPKAEPAAVSGTVSPRARKTAQKLGVSLEGISGTGPGGRIIERDVLAAEGKVSVSPAAREMIASGKTAPARGSGIGGRILSSDLTAGSSSPAPGEEAAREIPVKGVRKLIGDRMLASLQSTAQLTMNASADARDLQAYRSQCKAAADGMGTGGITLNDMILYAVSRVLPEFGFMNAEMYPDKIIQYSSVNLGFAVDTERGLMVPVIRNAHRLSLKALSSEAKRLGRACIEGTVSPDDLSGATFTVSNLGALGVGHFTPVLNAPQVGILGVGGIELKPVQTAGDVAFIPHLPLSLTIDHRAVDGAPGARFLQALSSSLANFRLVLAE
jgi:pyruvate dehydrogenase E2 component (dihydrolipoyllysine-residue acetyltransferase)